MLLGLSRQQIISCLAMNMRLGCIYNIIFLEKRGLWSQKCQRRYKIAVVANFVSIMMSQRQKETHFFFVETDRTDTWDRSSKVCRDS